MIRILKRFIPNIILSFIQEKRYYKRKKTCLNKKKSGNLRIAFVISFAQSWRSVASVYKQAAMNGFEVCVFLMNSKMKSSDNTSILDLFKQQGINYINVCDADKIYDIREWNPDYVFYTRPYNSEYPREYTPAVVSEYAKTCYIPYGFTLKNNYIFDSVFSWEFILNINIVFVQSDNQKSLCHKKFAWQHKNGRIQFVSLGFPRFDEVIKSKSDDTDFTIVWMPRWEFRISKKQEGQTTSHFLDYVDCFVSYMDAHKSIRLIIRPHPLMFSTIISENILSQNELDELIDKLNSLCNIKIDTEMDYMYAIENTDVLIADLTSLMTEYFVTGKPIIYCDDFNEFNDDGLIMKDAVYCADNWSEIQMLIEHLKSGNDSKKELRNNAIFKLTQNHCGNIGKSIIEYLIEDNNRL